MKRRSVMEPRFIWLLEEMCRNSGVDVQLIDLQLTYGENKEEIERMTGVRLHLDPMKNGIFDVDHPDETYAEWKAQEERYNALIGVKKGRKKDKKVPVDIGNIIRACGAEE